MIKFSDVFGDNEEKKKPAAPQVKKEDKKEEKGGEIKFSSPAKEEKKEDSLPPAKNEPAPAGHVLGFSSLFKNNQDNVSSQEDGRSLFPDIEFSSLLDQQRSFSDPPAAARPDKDNQLSGGQKEAFADDDAAYRQAVTLAQEIFSSDTDLTEKQVRQIADFVDNLIDCVKGNDHKFMEHVFENVGDDNILVAMHFANVCILALELGVGLNYTTGQLRKLGAAAFLHDLGLRKYRDLVNQKRKLTLAEIQKVQKHPLDAAEIIKIKGDNLGREIGEIIEQQHERIDGSGYPRGLKDGDINEMSQIIGFVDVYEALTHRRPYRGKYTPIEALKIILEDKGSFSSHLTKVFLTRIGFYPKGTFVELNTKEVAEVVGQNNQMPSCPVVKVIYGHDGKKTDQPREIDLSRGAKVFITKSL